MLASLRNIDQFEYSSEGDFLKWLNKIVENRIRDQLDHQQAARRDHRLESPLQDQRSPQSSIPLDIPDTNGLPTPSQVLMRGEDLARLERAMDQLPDETREMIVAVKLEGRTYQELADDTGKSPDAVRMQVNRAMEALTNVYRELEPREHGND